MNWKRHRWIWFSAALAGVAIIVLLVRSGRPATPVTETREEHADEPAGIVEMNSVGQQNIRLETQPASLRTIFDSVETTGSVAPIESRVAHIRAISQGRILKVLVRLGDEVRQGQPLVVYDNIELGELIGQFESAAAVLTRVRAEAAVAKRSLERAQNLVTLGAVAKAELERRGAEYAAAQAAIEAQQAERTQIEEKLHRFGLSDNDIQRLEKEAGPQAHREHSQSTLRAPFAGVVTAYEAAEGELVGPDKELITVANLSTVWVEANIYEKDLRLVRKGVRARITFDAYPNVVFSGPVTYISNTLDPETRTATLRVEVANPNNQLKVAMFATVRIPVPAGREAVAVPETAVQLIEDSPVVFVKIGPERFERRDVELGVRDEDWVEITRGVKEGDPVVTTGSFEVKSNLLREEIGGEH